MKLSTIVAGATFFASNVLATDSDSIIIKAHCRLQFFYKITSVVSLSALAEAYGCLGRREEGVAAAEKSAARLQHLLGENHIQVLAAVLCTAELVVSKWDNDLYNRYVSVVELAQYSNIQRQWLLY
ncbi:tetratricopeptide repeat protein [Aspergillus tanneri]|uniref:1,3-beta-glucanosyltransferase gas1 n=1 Tax=Aspergillus tanneri TaxID=1220188 RepID=A0A5M9MWU2_9EURO|nr:1,3-beta-glucanosyltransferase gas1 [Aspergillus tanneri]KAA8649800.1 1,3-beta-glucanosyltransferase gas1 [Aspergillus tanneri]